MRGKPNLRIALVGCGAVGRERYAPALRLVPEHSVEWFVDTNVAAARRAAAVYGRGNVAQQYNGVIDKVDAAIVAVPNYLHSKVSVDFLKAGRDVLCEKPVAVSLEEGARMVKASQASGARLAVNQIRRRFDNYQMAKEILERGIIGTTSVATYTEGHIFSWPVASSFILQKEKSGGGVLIDLGAHAIDILRWFFPGRLQVVWYKDDGLGRVEANCDTLLRIDTGHGKVECALSLSRTRKLANSLVIEGDRGRLEIRHFDLHRVYLRLADRAWKMEREDSSRRRSELEYFADQVRAFLDKSSGDIVDGSEALKSLSVIEECYKRREHMNYPWISDCEQDWQKSIALHYQKILVVGASGFLGSTLAERLALRLGATVRVNIHRASTAVRLARLPVEYVECDLLNREQVMRCVEGCDVVVNCARDRSGERKGTLDVLIRGTQNLLEAAAKHNVRKFVHISSAAVHGFKHVAKVVDESAPFKFSLDPYVMGKIKSEKIVMSFSRQLPVVILRPTLIYGPFSADWVAGIADRLKNHMVTLIGDDGLANLVFVSDVVDAILLAIEKDEANGKAFIVNNDRDVPAWRDYIQQFCDVLNVTPVELSGVNRFDRLSRTASLFRDSAHAARSLLRSSEMLAFLAQIPLVVAVGAKLIRGERRKRIESQLALPLELASPDPKILLRYETIDRPLSEVFTCKTVFSASRARNTLGFEPSTSFSEGMRKTLEWIKWAYLV
jgi:predicted dehydrogenase/nucleoside-diphosphate-sugar epimerase